MGCTVDIEAELKTRLEEANSALDRLRLLYDIVDKEEKALIIQNNKGLYNPNSFLTREFKVDVKNYEGNS